MNDPYLPAGASDSDGYFDLLSVQDEDEAAADEPGAIDDEGDY